MTARLGIGSQPVTKPEASLHDPGHAVVFLTASGSHLSFTTAASAREVAAACARAAELLEGRQVTEA